MPEEPLGNSGPPEPPPTQDAPPTRTSVKGEEGDAAPGGVPESMTGNAPTFRPMLRTEGTREPAHLLGLPCPGQCLGDFELLSILGVGSFAKVFLARQVSLGRQVALKVSANRGSEALTLARLEHDHIVHVFSEAVDGERDLRLLCMQYVPGTTLEHLIQALAGRDRREWDGRAILEAIDALSRNPATLDPAALRDREFLADCDFVEAVCWIGARVAEALAYAHDRGVLHRDVKPANILFSCYGRPLLADFNVAFCKGPDCEQRLGGTLAYMAPEHLDAFNPEDKTPPGAVDHRADVYALGVVLFQLLTGRLPFDPPPRKGGLPVYLRQLADQRRAGAPSPSQGSEVPEVLDRVVRRCLDPRPEGRYQGAHELARALDGCRQLRRAQRNLPPAGPVTAALLGHPFLVGAFLILLPHFLGSVVNVSYNALRIVDQLSDAQKAAFARCVLAYNLLVYPASLVLIYCLVAPIGRMWRRLSGPEPVDGAEVEAVRRRALALPWWAVALSCMGWLPGGLLFPLAIGYLSEPAGPAVFGHFLVSFTVSGLIALTYSVFAVQFLVLRVLYPRLWADAQGMRQLARRELLGLERRLSMLQFLAVLIPLAGAVLMLREGPHQFRDAGGGFNSYRYDIFRLLVTALIALGMLGLGVALMVSGMLNQTLAVLVGSGRRAGPTRPPGGAPRRGPESVAPGTGSSAV